jgi:tetratricopeptide (TPR) repeat protein
LSILSGLWIFDGALVILASLGMFGLAVLAYQVGQAPGAVRGETLAGGPLFLATIGFVVLLFGAFRIGVGRALRARSRWALYAAAVLTALNLVAALVIAANSLNVRQALLAQGGPLPQQAQAVAGVLGGLLLWGVFIQLIFVALVGFSYHDFFGPMRRFVPTFNRTEHTIHYNNGVAYKNRGMWYMAMREWELAILKAQRNVTYLHALGLAYAQLGRFDRARATLDRALEFEPNHTQLRESRQLVDQMAARSS